MICNIYCTYILLNFVILFMNIRELEWVKERCTVGEKIELLKLLNLSICNIYSSKIFFLTNLFI